MGDLTYVVGKLGAAVYELQRAGDIRARLFSAWMRGLARILPDALPDELRDEYEEIMEALSRPPPRGGRSEGRIVATLAVMTGEEADSLAKKIVSLYSRAAEKAGHAPVEVEADALYQEEIGAPEEHPKIVGPPPGPAELNPKRRALEKVVGKTISNVEYGVEASHPEWKHEGEAIVLHFTDGTALSIEVGSNAKNLSEVHAGLKPGDIHTELLPMWREGRRPPE